MKKLKFTIIKKPVSQKEKLERVKFYMEDTGEKISIDEFLKKEIFDEYVEMKCLYCDYEETLDFDILKEMMDMYGTDYPEEYCPKCEHGMVPKDLYFQFKEQFRKK